MIARLAGLAAAAAVLAACGGTPEHNAQPPIPSAHASTSDNRAAARAESARMLTILTPPNGGKVVDASPLPDLREELEGVGPSDGRLSRHAWWTVPMSPQDFATWLKAEHVAGMTAGDGGSSSAPDGTMVDIVELDGTGTAAYSAPVLTFAYLAHDGGVAVRLDTFLAARYARTVYVPTDTTHVDIRTRTTTYGTAHVRTHRVSVSDPAKVQRLVAAANALPGIVTVPNVFHCPLVREVTTYAVTFAAPSGSFVLTGSSTPCGAVVVLRRDGHVIAPSLDPGTHWLPLLGI